MRMRSRLRMRLSEEEEDYAILKPRKTFAFGCSFGRKNPDSDVLTTTNDDDDD
jgi:hypothetical protein